MIQGGSITVFVHHDMDGSDKKWQYHRLHRSGLFLVTDMAFV